MRPRTVTKILLLLLLLLIAALLIQCTTGSLFKAKAALGDTQIRPLDEMTMVYVPAGEFMIGIDYLGMRYAIDLCKQVKRTVGPGTCLGSSFADEMPAHPVQLDGYWIDRTEVTNGQYERCLRQGSCTPPSDLGSFNRPHYFGNPDYADYPVVWITHDQAAEYCAWAGARLPTEAEWEFAARGPESLTFPWGDDFDSARANYCDSSCASGVIDPSYDDGYPETAPVGRFPSGESWSGALDMAGNVREWVADWFGYYSADPQKNPAGPENGDSYIPKGGSWLDTPDDLRSSNRGQNTPDYTRHKVGFRCVMDE